MFSSVPALASYFANGPHVECIASLHIQYYATCMHICCHTHKCYHSYVAIYEDIRVYACAISMYWFWYRLSSELGDAVHGM